MKAKFFPASFQIKPGIFTFMPGCSEFHWQTHPGHWSYCCGQVRLLLEILRDRWFCGFWKIAASWIFWLVNNSC